MCGAVPPPPRPGPAADRCLAADGRGGGGAGRTQATNAMKWAADGRTPSSVTSVAGGCGCAVLRRGAGGDLSWTWEGRCPSQTGARAARHCAPRPERSAALRPRNARSRSPSVVDVLPAPPRAPQRESKGRGTGDWRPIRGLTTRAPRPASALHAGRGRTSGGSTVRVCVGGGGIGMSPSCVVLVCRGRRLLADRHSLPVPWDPFPPSAAVPIGPSPPCALPLPPWPILPSLLPFPFPWPFPASCSPGRGRGRSDTHPPTNTDNPPAPPCVTFTLLHVVSTSRPGVFVMIAYPGTDQAVRGLHAGRGRTSGGSTVRVCVGGGGDWHVAVVCCSCLPRAAPIGRSPFAARPSDPFPSIGGGAQRPLTALCPPSLCVGGGGRGRSMRVGPHCPAGPAEVGHGGGARPTAGPRGGDCGDAWGTAAGDADPPPPPHERRPPSEAIGTALVDVVTDGGAVVQLHRGPPMKTAATDAPIRQSPRMDGGPPRIAVPTGRDGGGGYSPPCVTFRLVVAPLLPPPPPPRRAAHAQPLSP